MHPPSRQSRRVSRMGIFVITCLGLIGVAALWPSPYVLERPGPVVNALGEISTEEGNIPVVSISEIETYSATGAVQVLSVNLKGSPEHPLSWLEALPGLIDPTQILVPVREVFPNDSNAEDRDATNAALMQSSQVQATAAALQLLGEPATTQVVVASVSESGAAAGLLREGDVILSAGGSAITSVTELRSRVAEYTDDAGVPLEIVRDGVPQEVRVTPQRESDTDPPILGIAVSSVVEFPFDVDIEMDRIGGPSAGLTFAIAVYELLSEDDLLGGMTVSATGTVDVDGSVGPIGGLPQKMWGASRAGSELMLFPVANCQDVPNSVPKGLQLVPVASLAEAVDAITEFRDNGSVVGMERCVTPAA